MNDTFNSEEQLIEALRLDDNRALSVLYKLYFGSINHFIITNNGSEDDAKDIFQEAIIVFYQKVKDQNFVLNCKIKTYLYSVSRLMWLKKIKNAKSIVGNINDMEEFITIDENQQAEIEEQEAKYSKMAIAMGGLGEPCKSLIEDFYINQLSMVEIAEKFGYTNADNAKTQKYKCLMRLIKMFFK